MTAQGMNLTTVVQEWSRIKKEAVNIKRAVVAYSRTDLEKHESHDI
jgi:hypothetical protein